LLTAANTNGYLMQGILVFANAAARDAAITSPQEGQACYLKDTDQVLTYSGSAWVAVGGGASGATLISRTSFTASSSVTVDSLFSSTYENYLVCIQATSSVGNVNLQLRARYGSTTHTGANYQYAFSGTDTASSTAQGFRANGVTSWVLGLLASTEVNVNNFTFFRQDASAHLSFTGGLINKENGYILSGGAFVQSNQSWAGLNIFPASGTITGQISVYGLAKS